MPITVKHGPSFGNAGEILSRAVQGELERANQRAMQMRELQNRGAIASAQIQMEYEGKREANQTAIRMAAMKAGLAKDMQTQEYMQSLMAAKEKGKQEAANTEYKYTTEQRIEDARYAKAERMIQQSSNFTPEERNAALQRLSVARAGVRQPTEVLGDPNKPRYEEGKEPGKVWQGENGGWFSSSPDGTVKLQVRPDQTPEYLQKKQENELKIKQEELRGKRDDKIFELRAKLATEQVEEIKDDVKSKRFLSPEEIEERIAMMEGRQPEAAASADANWWEPLQAQGWQVTQEDVDLPQQVGGSQAYIRTLNAQYGGFDQVPEELKAGYVSAARVIEQYTRSQRTKPKSNGRKVTPARKTSSSGSDYGTKSGDWFSGG